MIKCSRARSLAWMCCRLFISACLSVGLSSCGDSAKESPTFLHAHVSGMIATFSMDPADGQLTPVTGSPFAIVGGLRSLSVSPSGRFIAGVGPQELAVHEVSTEGQIQAVAGSPFVSGWESVPLVYERSSAPWSSVSFTYHPSERYAYVVRHSYSPTLYPCYGPGDILAFDADPQTGALTRRSGSVPTATLGSRLAIVGSDKFGYVGCAGDDTGLYGPCPAGGLNGYAIGADGGLTPLAPLAYAERASNNALAVGNLLVLSRCSGPGAYDSCFGDSGFMDVFHVDATGALTLASTVSLNGYMYWMVADPLGQYVFCFVTTSDEVTDERTAAVVVVRIQASGEASIVSRVALTPGDEARLAVDPQGRYLYAGYFRARTIVGWRINRSSGALEPLSHVSTALSSGPTTLVFSQRQQ